MRPTSLFLTTSCATTELWEATDPGNRKIVPADDPALAAIEPDRLAPYVGPDGCDYLLVEKTRLRKTGDLGLRMVGLPVALTADVAATTVVAGMFLVYGAAASGCYYSFSWTP